MNSSAISVIVNILGKYKKKHQNMEQREGYIEKMIVNPSIVRGRPGRLEILV